MTTAVKFNTTDITRHVGTEIEGIKLLAMSDAEVQELLHLVADRGVVVVRDQPMSIAE